MWIFSCLFFKQNFIAGGYYFIYGYFLHCTLKQEILLLSAVIDIMQHWKIQEIWYPYNGQKYLILTWFWNFEGTGSKIRPYFKGWSFLQVKIWLFYAWNGLHFSCTFQCCMWSPPGFYIWSMKIITDWQFLDFLPEMSGHTVTAFFWDEKLRKN